MVSKLIKEGIKKAARKLPNLDKKLDKKATQLGTNSKKSTDKSKAYSAMAKIRSGAKVKPQDDPRNYPRDASNPFGKRDEMEKTGIKSGKKPTTKKSKGGSIRKDKGVTGIAPKDKYKGIRKAKGGMVGKPKGCGAATRGYGKAMKGKK